AEVFQFGHGQQPAGPSRMTGDENEFAVARARRREAEKILYRRRLAILVGAEQANIQIVARELEVVGIAAVERNLLLRREYQSHVGVAFEAIQMIRAALPKRDDIGAQARAIQ